MPRIKELPQSERPRERLISLGAGALSNQELLSLLIGSGMKGESAMSLASRVLESTDEGIVCIQTASAEELSQIGGIGKAIACRILAAAELGKRMSTGLTSSRMRPMSPEDVAALFMQELRYAKNEIFKVLLLNVRGEMTGKETVSLGNISSSIVDAREVFRPAVKRGAASIVMVHNHPSGDPSPSPQDVEVTQALIEAGGILGIKVVDHLIIGDGCFVSLRQEELM
ncbi:MAG: DNA repair protein RadC [Clostridiales Family XIII bacterium]|jgi:DNA repair protein RadC|nr:DNA repair protein RadC [Clostridiales Family XIII bacterium]